MYHSLMMTDISSTCKVTSLAKWKLRMPSKLLHILQLKPLLLTMKCKLTIHVLNFILCIHIPIMIHVLSSCVRVVASTRSGMGKSLRIKRMAEQLHLNLNQEREHLVTIPLHGPVVTPDRVLDFLEEHAEDPECTIYHLDIAPSVSCLF